MDEFINDMRMKVLWDDYNLFPDPGLKYENALGDNETGFCHFAQPFTKSTLRIKYNLVELDKNI